MTDRKKWGDVKVGDSFVIGGTLWGVDSIDAIGEGGRRFHMVSEDDHSEWLRRSGDYVPVFVDFKPGDFCSVQAPGMEWPARIRITGLLGGSEALEHRFRSYRGKDAFGHLLMFDHSDIVEAL